MESLTVIWNLLLLLSVFVFPQLLGVLLRLRLTRFPRWLACVFGIVSVVLSFFYLSSIFFLAGLREASARGEVNCGMPALAAAFLVLIGTGIQFCAATVVHLLLSRRARTIK
jgi:hypothetical protein